MPRVLGPALALIGLVPTLARADDPKGTEFFEKKIRPVLTEQCGQCHSAEAEAKKKLKGGLRLDTRDGLLKGGDSGPAVVAGKPADSLLVQAVQYEGDTRMPPKGKLPDAVVADFVKWVEMGAPDPRTGGGAKRQIGLSVAEGRKFWAYIPPKEHPIPAVQIADWPANDIDRFVLAALEAKALKPAPDADRLSLVRRLYYDLVGLPPTPEEADAFVHDQSPDAYPKLVEHLLQCPQFGERWGRHWLDVARYGESLTLRGFILKEAWRYRDYVIDAFNRDLPFDRFIREQIAGDLLPAGSLDDRRRQLVATTFLALGNTNLEEQDKQQLRMDVVDEQLDVVTKGFLGQTVTCARCHDHKFDPIPTRDYYALAGILRNAKAMEHATVSKWIEVPLPADPVEEEAIRKHERAVAALQAKIKAEKAKVAAKGGSATGVVAVNDVPGVVVDDAQAKKVGEWQHSVHSGSYIGAGYVHDQNVGKGQKTLSFEPELPATGRYEVRLAYSPGTSRSDAVPVTVFSADGEKTIPVDMKKGPPIDGRFVSLGEYRFEKTGQSFVIVSNEGTTGHVTADAVTFIPVGGERPATKDKEAAKSSDTLRVMEAELKRLQETGPKRQMVMTVVEEKTIEDTKVHVRGSVHNLGEPSPRGFLQVANRGPAPSFPKTQSGRKELAEWVASADNPLTARVYANRAWHHLLGAGLVRTTDNFGTTGELPSHPDLLDYLALRFIEDEWSVKALVRRIVLSRAYRQSSAGDAKIVAADPENRLLGRANRRRLEAECLRDTMLVVSGKLSLESGGPTYPAALAADYGYKPKDTRRTVYSPVFRNALPEGLEVFDFADPSMVTGRRNTSTVAPQALYLMNNAFPIEQAMHAAARLLSEPLADDAARLTRAYQRALGREPTAGEREVMTRFLKR
ncbi:MAG TPA: DUF1553 domain-containing protein, partial [Gemmataceae bacterium]|nr:DUF1553 domain-containing protein [Gemmataceae bacterium]